jgi:hypothetical protein
LAPYDKASLLAWWIDNLEGLSCFKIA